MGSEFTSSSFSSSSCGSSWPPISKVRISPASATSGALTGEAGEYTATARLPRQHVVYSLLAGSSVGMETTAAGVSPPAVFPEPASSTDLHLPSSRRISLFGAAARPGARCSSSRSVGRLGRAAFPSRQRSPCMDRRRCGTVSQRCRLRTLPNRTVLLTESSFPSLLHSCQAPLTARPPLPPQLRHHRPV